MITSPKKPSSHNHSPRCSRQRLWWMMNSEQMAPYKITNCFLKDFLLLLLLFALHQTQPLFLQTCQSQWNRRLFLQIIGLFYWKTFEIQQTLLSFKAVLRNTNDVIQHRSVSDRKKKPKTWPPTFFKSSQMRWSGKSFTRRTVDICQAPVCTDVFFRTAN